MSILYSNFTAWKKKYSDIGVNLIRPYVSEILWKLHFMTALLPQRYVDSDFGSFQSPVTTFSTDQHQMPCTDKKSTMSTLCSMVNETGSRNWISEVCKYQFWFRLGITSTIFYRFLPNFASDSGMSSHQRSSLLILEVCGFWFRQFSGSGEQIFQPISTRSYVQIKFGNADSVFDGEWNRK